MSHHKKLSILAIALTAVGTAAYATKGMENDALAITQAKIPLAQAVTTAEQHIKGRALHAEYEQTRKGWLYDVEVVSGNKVFDVKVDANNGTVIASTEDTTDHDDEHDKDD